MPFAEKKMERASKRGDKSFYGKRESARKSAFLKPNSKKALCAENHLPQELLLQEEFPAQGILCQRNRTFPSRCSWNAAIYWVGFTFRNPPGTQPTVRSEVYLSCGSKQLAAMQLSAQLSHTATLTRGQAVSGRHSRLHWTGGCGRLRGWAGTQQDHQAAVSAAQQGVTGASLRVGPGSLTAGVQVLPAEAGTHSVPDRAAGAGGAQAASPQLRPQIPALGGHVIRCSCASRPAWEPVPRSNGGSPALPSQRSTCQGQ